jgi:Ca-activated chloride channel family protein
MKGLLVAIALTLIVTSTGIDGQDAPRFRNAVELVEVTATVTDKDGRFATDLRQEDFAVYEDGKLQTISHFSNERAPISLGILLDSSGSMDPEKMGAAKASIARLVMDLLDPDDEFFFVEFGYSAALTQEWTSDRRLIRRALDDVRRPTGDTALNDAIALALPTAEAGRHGKKALLVITDGNDTNSAVSLSELRQLIMDTDVLVYALGIDRASPSRQKGDQRLDAEALRQITDDTGGRTEIVRGPRALDATITRLADELRHQYSFGFSSGLPSDGQWHSIHVDTRGRRLNVRARRGYVAF